MGNTCLRNWVTISSCSRFRGSVLPSQLSYLPKVGTRTGGHSPSSLRCSPVTSDRRLRFFGRDHLVVTAGTVETVAVCDLVVGDRSAFVSRAHAAV